MFLQSQSSVEAYSGNTIALPCALEAEDRMVDSRDIIKTWETIAGKISEQGFSTVCVLGAVMKPGLRDLQWFLQTQ